MFGTLAPQTTAADARLSLAKLRCLSLSLLAAAQLCGAAPAAATTLAGPTDANIVTAIDVSDSIGRHEEWLQHVGITRALVHPEFLRAVMAGRHERVGVAVFTWSSDGRFDLLVPWTIIGSPEDAARVSAAFGGVTLVDRSNYGGGDHEDRNEEINVTPDRLTDISGAIAFAASLLASAPYAAERSVMNILANGIDNVGGGAESSRDDALAAGFTVNGLVLRGHEKVTEYFRSNVIGGPGAFVMAMSDPGRAGDIMARKLSRDLLASIFPQAGSRPDLE